MTMSSRHENTIEGRARACRKAFADLLSIPDTNGEKTEWAEEQQARFNMWIASLGIMAPGYASFEYRLRDRQDVYQLILQLLLSLSSNLALLGQSDQVAQRELHVESPSTPVLPRSNSVISSGDDEQEVVSSPGSSFASVLSDDNTSMDLQYISEAREDAEAAISRLNRISTSIRRTGIAQRSDHAQRVVSLGPPIEDLALEHEQYARQVLCRELRNIQGEGAEQFMQHTLQVIMRRWRLIHYRRQHKQKLAFECRAEDEQYSTGPSSPLIQASNRVGSVIVRENAILKDSHPPSTAHPSTYATELGKRTIREEDLSTNAPSNATKSSLPGRRLDIPKAPRVLKGNDVFECPYCCILCPLKYARVGQWKNHLLQDLSPYYCLFDDCSDRLQMFQTASQWITHMQHNHAPTEWYCTMPLCKEPPFPMEVQFRAHLQSVHKDDLNDTRINTLVTLNRRAKAEVLTKCRFCGGIPQDLIEDEPTPQELQIRLQKHVGQHMQQLALISLPFDDMDSQNQSVMPSFKTQGQQMDGAEQSIGSETNESGTVDSPPALIFPSSHTVYQDDDDVSAYSRLECRTIDDLILITPPFPEELDQTWLQNPEQQNSGDRERDWPLVSGYESPAPENDPALRSFAMSSEKRRRPQATDFTVAWIAALPIVSAAATIMLDEEFDDMGWDSSSDIYKFGRIGNHYVVITSRPIDRIGSDSIAIIIHEIHVKFKSIQFGLLIGLGGGVPSSTSDVRLGDVVISLPHEDHGAVVQYDFTKTGTETRSSRPSLLNTPPELLTALAKLRDDWNQGRPGASKHLALFHHLPQFDQAFAGPDILFEADYPHATENTCDDCNRDRIIQRTELPQRGVVTHYGTIASGTQVIKSGTARDKLSASLGGVLCFASESAAALVDVLPCLDIRGICDYADSHMNRSWQGYASATAAACAKELLLIIPPLETPFTQAQDSHVATETNLSLDQRRSLIQSLAFGIVIGKMSAWYQKTIGSCG